MTPMQDAMPVYGQAPPVVTTLSQFDPTGTRLKFSTFLGGAAASGLRRWPLMRAIAPT